MTYIVLRWEVECRRGREVVARGRGANLQNHRETNGERRGGDESRPHARHKNMHKINN